MLQMIQILILLAFLLGGALAASLRLAPKPRIVEISITAALWLLLFSMGFRIGNNPELVHSIGTIGLLGFVAAVCTIAGSCAVVWLMSRLSPHAGAFRKQESAVATSFNAPMESGGGRGGKVAASLLLRLKPPAILLAVVVAGFIAGLLLPELGFDPGIITEWTLNALLFLIGMQFRQSKHPPRRYAQIPGRLWHLPLASGAGKASWRALSSPLSSRWPLARPWRWRAALGGTAFSRGVHLAIFGDPLLGSSAFLANMIRESLGSSSIPLSDQTRVPVIGHQCGRGHLDGRVPSAHRADTGPEAVPLSLFRALSCRCLCRFWWRFL